MATQFLPLYGLGSAIGASFVYSPVSFNRSVKPKWYNVSQSFLFKLRCFFFFYIGQNFISSAVNGLFLYIEKKLNAILERNTDNELSVFLGLKYTSEVDPYVLVDNAICDILLDNYLESIELIHIADFKEYVNCFLKDRTDNPVLRFKWTAKMWTLIPKLDLLLQDTGYNKEKILQNTFSNGFWKQHKPSFPDKTNIVFHIRCGDSTTIRLGERNLIVFDKYLYESEQEMDDVLAIDQDRYTVLPEEYTNIYDQIISKIGVEDIRLTVISDGYELTFKNILRNLLKRKCKIHLTRFERKDLALKIKESNDIFSHFRQAQLIIGETKQNLNDSIYALANANVVIWGCGGFASNTHSLFKGVEQKSLIFNVKDFSEMKIKLIKELKNA
ncbi:MAG: hypothetical protein PHT07_10940 [Paludibacter sp.]|nr:hypothetical protein [Paludibacter sp.]